MSERTLHRIMQECLATGKTIELTRDELCKFYSDFEQQLSASQAREADLQKKLEAEQESFKIERAAHIETLGMLHTAKKRAAAAEVRIEASQEQEPVAWRDDTGRPHSLAHSNPHSTSMLQAQGKCLFPSPVIPTDLATRLGK